MNLSQRLRTCAKHTGLDAVIELLNEAADEIERLSGGHHPLPTLQPGDSHMESLIEAAIQGHAGTRDAMRWLVRQLVPATQPAEVTDEQILTEAARHLGEMHVENAYLSDILSFARAILALRPVQVPVTDDDVDAKCLTIIGHLLSRRERDRIVWRMAEAHHGLTAQAKKEAP